MKKSYLLLIAIAFTAFAISCNGDKKSSDSTENEASTEVIEAAPLLSADEVRSIEKMDETQIAELENKDDVIRFCSSYSLDEFPADVLEATNLQTIELNGYNGTTLPEELKNLQNITVIYISGGTNMTEIPAFLPEMKNLKTFAITAANNLDLNAAFKILSQCENLENIQINYSEIECELPAEIGNMTNLKTLDISKNMFQTFPEEFYNLANLEYINISPSSDYAYNMEAMFEGMAALPNLSRIAVFYAGLTELPAVLNDYPSLTHIQWAEDGAGWGTSDEIKATTENEDLKFENIMVDWSTGSSMFYDMY